MSVIMTFTILAIFLEEKNLKRRTVRSLTLVEVKSSDGSLRGPSSPEQVLFLIFFRSLSSFGKCVKLHLGVCVCCSSFNLFHSCTDMGNANWAWMFSLQVTDLSYEWEVKTSWDDGRDLKAREPYFSSGEYFKEGQSELQVHFDGAILGNRGRLFS